MDESEHPIVCNRSPDDAARDVGDLIGLARTVERVPGGFGLTLGVELSDRIDELAADEKSCCGKLLFKIEPARNHVRVELTSHDPVALARLDAIVMADRS